MSQYATVMWKRAGSQVVLRMTGVEQRGEIPAHLRGWRWSSLI